MKKKLLDFIERIIIIFLIIFGLFIAYQIVKKVFGGSWTTEALIIGLLMLNIGLALTNSIKIVKLGLYHENLSYQFKHLANDFKVHLNIN